MYTYKQRQDAIKKAQQEYDDALIRLEKALLELARHSGKLPKTSDLFNIDNTK